mmetsp:Transcript_77740/g.168177  ORF Transcript_77740/g.168177 Transcript_77740/m.168177 type:complete len:100 (+) Transcript_77740:90-389(+)
MVPGRVPGRVPGGVRGGVLWGVMPGSGVPPGVVRARFAESFRRVIPRGVTLPGVGVLGLLPEGRMASTGIDSWCVVPEAWGLRAGRWTGLLSWAGIASR